MKISVIIPAYNEASYIGETLAHVLAQDFPEPFEVIVVDNASTDATSAIASAFAGVKVVREDRKGVQFARERGRKEAKGRILAYLDADCLPPPAWLEKGASFFSDKNVVAVGGIYDYYDASFSVHFWQNSIQHFFFPIVHFFVQTVFKKGGVMMGGNFFARAETLKALGGFNTAIRFYGDDTDTAKRLTRQGKVLYRTDLIVKSSARRFIKQGTFSIFAIYIINFFWVLFRGRPFSR